MDTFHAPPGLPAIAGATGGLRLVFASTPEFGPLLRTLAASKAGGRCRELGAGVGTSWPLDGMDATAVVSVLSLLGRDTRRS